MAFSHPITVLLLLAFFLTSIGSVPWGIAAEGPIPVVATIPVLKDLVQAIGQSRVQVTSLLTGLENEHSYSPKPSDLVAVRKARLLVEIGAGLEVWASSLIRSAGNKQLVIVTTSRGIELIETEDSSHTHPSAGPSHGPATGNPHIWLDPENVVAMVHHITTALSQIAPQHAAEFQEHERTYVWELRRLTDELGDRLRHVSNRRIMTHHPAWPYFARRFDLHIAAEIQRQPGSEPSARHLQTLLTQIQREHIPVIVSEPQLNQKLPWLLAQESGAQLAVLTPLPGAIPGTETYLDMLRYNVLQLLVAFDRAAAASR